MFRAGIERTYSKGLEDEMTFFMSSDYAALPEAWHVGLTLCLQNCIMTGYDEAFVDFKISTKYTSTKTCNDVLCSFS